jgi:hypothetical protein
MSGIELVTVRPITTMTFRLITHLPSALGPTQPQVYSGVISWGVGEGGQASSDKVQNAWSCTSVPSHAFVAWTGTTLPFVYHRSIIE